MKNKTMWFAAGLTLGTVSLLLLRRYRQVRRETQTWQKQHPLDVELLACPACHGRLAQTDAHLHCGQCQRRYPIVDGIPHFVEPEQLGGLNQRFSQMYDWFSWGYRVFSRVAFAYIGMREEQARREVTDRLEPQGGRVLEVSVGPGVNLPYLVGRPDVGGIVGLDLSLGQLQRCQAFVARRHWDIQLHQGNAEQLPYPDNTFAGVFHIGGINFFDDRQKAIEEMIRVAKPGARILICDETEKGARAYKRFLPGFQRAAGPAGEPVVAPVALVPPDVRELRLVDVWKGWMYCLEFKKP